MINIRMPTAEAQLRPRITVVGVGGAGGNAVSNMIKSNLEGVEFLVCNTDAQALSGSIAEKRIQLGVSVTRGLGAGARPEVGRAAAEEQLDDICTYLEGSNMVFITAGMGGGTGTGAAPVIARAGRELGILTVGVVTKPFHFEGAHRMKTAEAGITELQQFVDTLIVIPNQNLFRIANEKTTFADAFKMADDVLYSGVRGVTDLMVMPGLINLDFADIRTVMGEMGKAMMGTGEAEGGRRAIDAAEAAISNPLLDDVSMKGARGVLINITGGLDMTLFEVDEAANRIRDEVDPNANIIFGSTFDESLEGRMRVSVVATGIDLEALSQPRPAATLSLVAGNGSGNGRKPAPNAWPAVTPPTRVGAEPLRVAEPAPLATVASSSTSAPVTMTATARQLEAEAAYEVQPNRVQPDEEEEPAASARSESRGGERLTAERHNEHFIPPRAVDPGPRPQSSAMSRAEGFAAAEPAPAPSEPARKKGPSLFERVTGAARRVSGYVETAMEPETPPQRAQIAPNPPRPQPQPAQPTPQPRLGVEPADRSKLTQADEDMLEIPAFLRRQAN